MKQYFVQPKKHLGQHFLRDENIARKVASSLTHGEGYKDVLEVGPGTGALTRWLINNPDFSWTGFDVDEESVAFLKTQYPEKQSAILNQDFLKAHLESWFDQRQFAVIGNFPYNISSQILFKVLEYRLQIPEVVGMFQREVASRIASMPGNKVYGILSVLTQAFYDVELLFQVGEQAFIPPPKVKSAVIRMRRKELFTLDCDEKLFFSVVKTAFNQRRKTLRNALKSMSVDWSLLPVHFAGQRAEQLDVAEFVMITRNTRSGLGGSVFTLNT